MFRRKKQVEIIQGSTNSQPVTGAYALDDSDPALFELRAAIEVDKIKVTKHGGVIVVELGNDKGSYLAVRVQ